MYHDWIWLWKRLKDFYPHTCLNILAIVADTNFYESFVVRKINKKAEEIFIFIDVAQWMKEWMNKGRVWVLTPHCRISSLSSFWHNHRHRHDRTLLLNTLTKDTLHVCFDFRVIDREERQLCTFKPSLLPCCLL